MDNRIQGKESSYTYEHISSNEENQTQKYEIRSQSGKSFTVTVKASLDRADEIMKKLVVPLIEEHQIGTKVQYLRLVSTSTGETNIKKQFTKETIDQKRANNKELNPVPVKTVSLKTINAKKTSVLENLKQNAITLNYTLKNINDLDGFKTYISKQQKSPESDKILRMIEKYEKLVMKEKTLNQAAILVKVRNEVMPSLVEDENYHSTKVSMIEISTSRPPESTTKIKSKNKGTDEPVIVPRKVLKESVSEDDWTKLFTKITQTDYKNELSKIINQNKLIDVDKIKKILAHIDDLDELKKIDGALDILQSINMKILRERKTQEDREREAVQSSKEDIFGPSEANYGTTDRAPRPSPKEEGRVGSNLIKPGEMVPKEPSSSANNKGSTTKGIGPELKSREE